MQVGPQPRKMRAPARRSAADGEHRGEQEDGGDPAVADLDGRFLDECLAGERAERRQGGEPEGTGEEEDPEHARQDPVRGRAGGIGTRTRSGAGSLRGKRRGPPGAGRRPGSATWRPLHLAGVSRPMPISARPIWLIVTKASRRLRWSWPSAITAPTSAVTTAKPTSTARSPSTCGASGASKTVR